MEIKHSFEHVLSFKLLLGGQRSISPNALEVTKHYKTQFVNNLISENESCQMGKVGAETLIFHKSSI